jgi:hypothetical protein
LFGGVGGGGEVDRIPSISSKSSMLSAHSAQDETCAPTMNAGVPVILRKGTPRRYRELQPKSMPCNKARGTSESDQPAAYDVKCPLPTGPMVLPCEVPAAAAASPEQAMLLSRCKQALGHQLHKGSFCGNADRPRWPGPPHLQPAARGGLGVVDQRCGDGVVAAQQEVGRLDIAVKEAPCVAGSHGAQHLVHHLRRLHLRKRAATLQDRQTVATRSTLRDASPSAPALPSMPFEARPSTRHPKPEAHATDCRAAARAAQRTT